MLDLRLLRHRERAGHGHLHLAVGVPAQEMQVLDLDRVAAPDRTNDPRNGVRVAAAVERRARVVDVDAVERGREAVRVAFSADLAVGDDVEARRFLGSDREHGRIVLRLGEQLLRDTPQLARPHPRRETAPARRARSMSHSGCG